MYKYIYIYINHRKLFHWAHSQLTKHFFFGSLGRKEGRKRKNHPVMSSVRIFFLIQWTKEKGKKDPASEFCLHMLPAHILAELGVEIVEVSQLYTY